MFLTSDNIPKEFFKFPRLANELNPRDTVFRMDFNDQQRREKPPFTSEDCPFKEKHFAVWDRLFEGELTKEGALEEITQLMEEYYGSKYTLYRGFNH